MGKWIGRLVLFGGIGLFGYMAYLSYEKGYFNLPEFSETSYILSYKDGFRAVVVNPEVSKPINSWPRFFRRLHFANPERTYLQLPLEVPRWSQDTWSFCHPPTDDERAEIDGTMPENVRRNLVGARFEAICKIDADGQNIWRGLIYSVPKQ